MKRLYGLALALLLVASPAYADIDEGVAVYNRGDYATALQELRPLAEQGEARAQVMLGYMYANGRGVPQDYAEATRWYRASAEQGNGGAQNNLGVLYEFGRGVPQDYAEAVKWYRKAAEQGIALAQSNLGSMYYKGWGVPQDYLLAHMWFNLAAAQSDWVHDEFRDETAKRMTREQIAEAQRLAREWKPTK